MHYIAHTLQPLRIAVRCQKITHEIIHDDAQAHFVEAPVRQIDLWVVANIFRIKPHPFERRAVDDNFMKRAMPGDDGTCGRDPVQIISGDLPMPVPMVAPGKERFIRVFHPCFDLFQT